MIDCLIDGRIRGPLLVVIVIAALPVGVVVVDTGEPALLENATKTLINA